MAKTTSIEWTDHTWTPVVGCDAIAPACANCYAALMAARLEAMGQEKYKGLAVRAGGKAKWTGKVTFWEPELVRPLTVQKASRWFLTSMGDVAHEKVTLEQVADMFGVMAVAGAKGAFHREQDGCRDQLHDGKVIARWPNYLSGPHTFMVLTKRAQRMSALLLDSRFRKEVGHAAYKWAHNRTAASQIADAIYPFDSDVDSTECWPMRNVFVGCTAEDQSRADELRPHMARIAAAGWNTFVSYEPALGQVDWTGWEFLKQLISGGESGHKARQSEPEWHRAARDYCAAHGIAYLFKQWGAWAPYDRSRTDGATLATPFSLDRPIQLFGKKLAGRLLDGVEHNGFPEAA